MNDQLPKLPYYHIHHLIAEGGFARVYWGIDLRSGFPVAIKELKINVMKHPEIPEMFKKEANHYLYYNHPNITRLVDYVERNGRLYIMMEFVEGKTLDKYIYEEWGPIPQEKALPIFLKLLDTIDYLHQKRVLHLDIKSNNVMLMPTGDIKLLDMGISAQMNSASTTVFGNGMGSRAYMPPEQLGKGQLSFYTDCWALGVVLFEILTAQLPFQGKDDEMKHKIHNGPTPKLQSFYRFINEQLQPIVDKALAKNPANRYQSCKDFANDVKRIERKR